MHLPVGSGARASDSTTGRPAGTQHHTDRVHVLQAPSPGTEGSPSSVFGLITYGPYPQALVQPGSSWTSLL
ncbi:hypothetical protein BD414DRAFT_501454 [Trametes punicea]|nr:hypothetical protein BD414DRAFT_501454 [Trametes punicea]